MEKDIISPVAQDVPVVIHCVEFTIRHTPLLGFVICFAVKMALGKVKNSLLQKRTFFTFMESIPQKL